MYRLLMSKYKKHFFANKSFVWGGCHMALPATFGYLVWNKDCDGLNFGEVEFAGLRKNLHQGKLSAELLAWMVEKFILRRNPLQLWSGLFLSPRIATAF